MNLAPCDYVILAMAAGGAVTGIFIGISGALAFLAGTAVSAGAARLGWPITAEYLESGIARAAATTLLSLVAFWIARTLVRRTVKVAVEQPGDAILGALAAALSGFALGLALIWLGQFLGIPGTEESAFLQLLVEYVG